MEPGGDDYERLKRIGHAKRPQVLGRGKDREAMRLKAPELVVVDQVIELLGDVRRPPLVHSGLLKLLDGMPRQVLELDAVRLRLLGEGRRAKVARHARLRAEERGVGRESVGR